MKINQIINEGLVFYAKNPDGTKTYSLVKDAEHLANLEQKYRSAEVQKLDFARQDVQDWLDSRGVNLRTYKASKRCVESAWIRTWQRVSV